VGKTARRDGDRLSGADYGVIPPGGSIDSSSLTARRAAAGASAGRQSCRSGPCLVAISKHRSAQRSYLSDMGMSAPLQRHDKQQLTGKRPAD
jgi:hypothetical protein